MKIQRRKPRSAKVYTESLNDIMFFLLLFFLIISTMVTPATISVLLPKSKTSDDTVIKKSIMLTVTADKLYAIEGKPVPFEGIEDALSAINENKTEGEEIIVKLQADKSLNLQDVVDLIDIGNKLHMKMVLFTEKEKS
jgi:biopolymer transport protein ExbD